jgi:L-threonylcarbamoyladenylate synthase
VRDQLGDKVDFIIDGGRTAVGVESTVLDLSGGHMPRILRPGGVSRETIEALIGAVEVSEIAGGAALREPPLAPISPGQLKSHYAPRTPLSLHRREAMAALPYMPGELYLFFSPATYDPWLAAQGTTPPPHSVQVLSSTGSTLLAAANLFDLLHELDRRGASCIHAEEAPPVELGPAINDRLFRAAG